MLLALSVAFVKLYFGRNTFLISLILLSLHFGFLTWSIKAGDIFGGGPFVVRASASNILALVFLSVAVSVIVWKKFSFPAGQVSTAALLSIFGFLTLYIPLLHFVGYTYTLLLISATLFTIMGLIASCILIRNSKALSYTSIEKSSSHIKIEARLGSSIRKGWETSSMLMLVTFLVLVEELLLNSPYAALGLTLALLALIFLPLSGVILSKGDVRTQRLLEVSGIAFANRVVLSPFPIKFLASPSVLPATYTLVLIACILYIAYRKIDLSYVRLARGETPVLHQVLAGLLTGYVLGFIEYFVLRPTPITALNLIQTLVYLAVVMVVFVGITEELLFRGLLQRFLEDVVPPGQAIGVASLIFALMHLGWLNPVEIVFAYAAGIVFGLLCYKTKSLVAPIIAHGFGNVVLYTIVLFS